MARKCADKILAQRNVRTCVGTTWSLLLRCGAGFGKTRFFTRYARNIAPWFHPPHWLFNIVLNQFLDQVRPSQLAQRLPVLIDSAQLVQDGRDCSLSVAPLNKLLQRCLCKRESFACRIHICWPPSKK